MKEKIKRIRELTREIECKYWAYMNSGGIPIHDEEIDSWENERYQIFKEIESKFDEEEVKEK